MSKRASDLIERKEEKREEEREREREKESVHLLQEGKKERKKERQRKLCWKLDEVTGEGLNVLLRVSLRVQSILPPYRTDHFRGARRHVLTPLHPDDSQSEKTSSHSHLLPATVSLSFSLTFFSSSLVRPPAASPLQYLRVCKPTSDFHLSRFASPTIRDIFARALCLAFESQCSAIRCNRTRRSSWIVKKKIVLYIDLISV